MRVPIRVLLTIPLLVLNFVSVGVVGWLFYSNSQQAVEKIAANLIDQISERINKQLDLYLATPHLINSLNANSIELGLLNLNDRESVESYFIKQFRAAYQVDQDPYFQKDKNELIRSINHFYIGTENEELFGAEYLKIEGAPNIVISRLEDGRIKHYLTKPNGSAQSLVKEPIVSTQNEPFDLFKREWYREGRRLWNNRRGAPGWSLPYCDGSTATPAMTAIRPVGKNEQILGVLGSDFLFSDIENYLKKLLDNLKIKRGKIFILNEKLELLIDSDVSQEGHCNPSGSGVKTFPLAENRVDLLISSLVKANPDNISSSHSGLNRINFKGENYFWYSKSFKDDYGLKLSIFVAIPESSFMSDINDNNYRTISFGFLALGITVILGLIISRLITQPVVKLEKAAQDLVSSINQEEALKIPINNPSELQMLAQAFEGMSARLKKLFVASNYFVPQNFLTVLGCKDVTEVKLGDYRRARMTILFSDIRSFTKLSETMTPEQNFKFINNYLERMEPEIIKNHGFIDKYIGDAVMALFGENSSPDHAVQAGLDMLRRLHEYNHERGTDRRPLIKIGIGIHTGEIILGTLGGSNRRDTTVIGRDVNRASRVEGLTKDFGARLLISEQTLNALENKNRYRYRYLGEAKVRGIDEPVRIYEIYQEDPEKIAASKEETAQIFQEGIAFYERQEYAQALEKFEDVFHQCSEGGGAEFYRKECRKHLENT